jgi:hypothetical protein
MGDKHKAKPVTAKKTLDLSVDASQFLPPAEPKQIIDTRDAIEVATDQSAEHLAEISDKLPDLDSAERESREKSGFFSTIVDAASQAVQNELAKDKNRGSSFAANNSKFAVTPSKLTGFSVGGFEANPDTGAGTKAAPNAIDAAVESTVKKDNVHGVSFKFSF